MCTLIFQAWNWSHPNQEYALTLIFYSDVSTTNVYVDAFRYMDIELGENAKIYLLAVAILNAQQRMETSLFLKFPPSHLSLISRTLHIERTQNPKV